MGLNIDRRYRINRNYKIYEKLGSGAFGEVYRVKSRCGCEFAAKFVSTQNKNQLETEKKAVPRAEALREHGVVYWYWFGRHMQNYVLVMDLLGESVWDLKYRFGRLGTKSILQIGIQVTKRIESLHSRGYIHRDIKPDNLVIGRHGHYRNCVYLIDCGFAKRYRDSLNMHIAKTAGHGYYGTVTFSSKYAHRGETLSRRSDLESLVYSMVYLRNRDLPWSGDHISSAQVAHMKETICSADLCRNLPPQIKNYYREVRDLSFAERPNYSRLRSYLRLALEMHGHTEDDLFEWS